MISFIMGPSISLTISVNPSVFMIEMQHTSSPTSQLRIANLSPARMFARFRRSLGRTICPRSSILTTADTLQQVQPAAPALDVVCASLSIIYPPSDSSDYSEELVIYKTVDESVNIATGKIPSIIQPFELERFYRLEQVGERGAASVGH